MMRKILLSVVAIALLAPILATLGQWQCHFMPSSESPMTHELLLPAAHRMECCAVRKVVLKKPLAELTSKFAPASLLDAPLKMAEGILDRRSILQESPPWPTALSAVLSSSPILRI